MIEVGFGIWSVAIPASLLAVLMIAERMWPRRELVLGRYPRWMTHAIFFITNAVIGRFLALIMVVAVAAHWAAAQKFGLLNLVDLPWWLETGIAFIILDFAMWLQHVAMHNVPMLWRMHAVHHSDRDLDVTTALRFHPFELVVSTLYKSAWVAALGVPVFVALAFELWVNANALFNHSNIALPARVDRWLRHILVTPDMHLVHHIIVPSDQHRNYGFALTIWDRVFDTYAGYHTSQPIGLTGAQNADSTSAVWSMSLPFRKVN